jgi:hypothetical protein
MILVSLAEPHAEEPIGKRFCALLLRNDEVPEKRNLGNLATPGIGDNGARFGSSANLLDD